MSFFQFFTFAAIYLIAVATPGPGVLAVIARGMNRGLVQMPAFIGGILMGDVFWLSCALLGLSAIGKIWGGFLFLVRGLGALYLLYLAYTLWVRKNEPSSMPYSLQRETFSQAFLRGLLLTLPNPKAIVFFLALLPSMMDIQHISWRDIGALLLVCALVLPSVLGAYAIFSTYMEQKIQNEALATYLRRGLSLTLVGVALSMVVSV